MTTIPRLEACDQNSAAIWVQIRAGALACAHAMTGSAIVLGSSAAITSFLALLTCSLGDQVQRARQLQAVRALDITLSPCDPATAVQLAAAIHHMRTSRL